MKSAQKSQHFIEQPLSFIFDTASNGSVRITHVVSFRVECVVVVFILTVHGSRGAIREQTVPRSRKTVQIGTFPRMCPVRESLFGKSFTKVYPSLSGFHALFYTINKWTRNCVMYSFGDV